ncbi:type II toxin-antitoxin system RelE/ParE family toxin, partial [Vibrio cholerae]
VQSIDVGGKHNKRLKRDCQRVAFPVPLSRGGCSCCV